MINIKMKRSGGIIPDELVEELLNKFGPEGAYELSTKLIKAADDDVKNALSIPMLGCDLYGDAINDCDRFRFRGEIACETCQYKLTNK